jgi:hypothetical protein
MIDASARRPRWPGSNRQPGQQFNRAPTARDDSASAAVDEPSFQCAPQRQCSANILTVDEQARFIAVGGHSRLVKIFDKRISIKLVQKLVQASIE